VTSDENGWRNLMTTDSLEAAKDQFGAAVGTVREAAGATADTTKEHPVRGLGLAAFVLLVIAGVFIGRRILSG
jgi:ElaB/YqjD/DUF883 family membrane-anchored ribosome-binding protein